MSDGESAATQQSEDRALWADVTLGVADGILVCAGLYSLVVIGGQLAIIIGEALGGQQTQLPYGRFRWDLLLVAALGAYRAESVRRRLWAPSTTGGDPVEH